MGPALVVSGWQHSDSDRVTLLWAWLDGHRQDLYCVHNSSSVQCNCAWDHSKGKKQVSQLFFNLKVARRLLPNIDWTWNRIRKVEDEEQVYWFQVSPLHGARWMHSPWLLFSGLHLRDADERALLDFLQDGEHFQGQNQGKIFPHCLARRYIAKDQVQADSDDQSSTSLIRSLKFFRS